MRSSKRGEYSAACFAPSDTAVLAAVEVVKLEALSRPNSERGGVRGLSDDMLKFERKAEAVKLGYKSRSESGTHQR